MKDILSLSGEKKMGSYGHHDLRVGHFGGMDDHLRQSLCQIAINPQAVPLSTSPLLNSIIWGCGFSFVNILLFSQALWRPSLPTQFYFPDIGQPRFTFTSHRTISHSQREEHIWILRGRYYYVNTLGEILINNFQICIDYQCIFMLVS